jgi:hypothetical protein
MDRFISWTRGLIPQIFFRVHRYTRRGAGVLGLLITLCGSSCRADEIIWGFEGIVTRVGDEITPPELALVRDLPGHSASTPIRQDQRCMTAVAD